MFSWIKKQWSHFFSTLRTRTGICDLKNVPIFHFFAILSTDDTNGVVVIVWVELAGTGGGGGSGGAEAAASLTLRGTEAWE